jgi:hypothetical protein
MVVNRKTKRRARSREQIRAQTKGSEREKTDERGTNPTMGLRASARFRVFTHLGRTNSPGKKLFGSPVAENPNESDLFEEDP